MLFYYLNLIICVDKKEKGEKYLFGLLAERDLRIIKWKQLL